VPGRWHPKLNKGNILGREHRHWFRAKFAGNRFPPPDDWTTLLTAAAEPDAQRGFSVADDVGAGDRLMRWRD